MNKNVTYLREGTHCPFSSMEFARQTTIGITEALGNYRDSHMNINVYTPPYAEGEYPDGFLRLLFYKETEEVPAQVGIEFGQTDDDNNVIRFGFDRHEWEKFPDDPHSGGINAVNFDEAWRIVCLLGKELKVRSISLSYGY